MSGALYSLTHRRIASEGNRSDRQVGEGRSPGYQHRFGLLSSHILPRLTAQEIIDRLLSSMRLLRAVVAVAAGAVVTATQKNLIIDTDLFSDVEYAQARR